MIPTIQEKNTQFPTMREMTERALQALIAVDFGGHITYETLTTICRADAQATRTRSAILRAGKRLLRDHNKLIRNVRTLGYEIAKPEQHADEAERLRGFARRRLRRALASVTFVKFEGLTEAQIGRLLTEQTRNAILLGAERKLSRRKELPPKRDVALPSGQHIVEMFTKKKTA